jgi:hypothetical protein
MPACCFPGFKPQFFPHLGDIQALFNRTGLTAASFLAHILAINLFAARALYLDGGRGGGGSWGTGGRRENAGRWAIRLTAGPERVFQTGHVATQCEGDC